METKQPEVKDACDWLRVSTVAQVDAGGIDTARAVTLEIAKRAGLNMRWSIDLPGISGARVMLTQQVKTLIRLIEVEGCKHIVLKETSRLMRTDRFGDYRILDIFKDNRVCLHTPSKSWDLSNPDDLMMFSIEMGISSRERETIRTRTNTQREKLRKDGLSACSALCLPLGIGYDRQRKVFYPTAEAEVVRLIFRLFTSGVSNFRKLTLATGISYHRIASILENSAYMGVRTYTNVVDPKLNKYKANDQLRYQIKVKRDVPLQVPMAGFKKEPILYPTIVTEEIFQHAQRILGVKRQQDWRGSRKAEEDDAFLFRGFLQCSECGGKFVCLPLKTGDYYICRNAFGQRRIKADGKTDWQIPAKSCRTFRVRAEVLDLKMGLTVVERLGNPAWVSQVLNSMRKEQNTEDIKKRGAALERQITTTEGKIRRLRMGWMAGDFGEDRAEHDRVKQFLEHQLDEERKTLRECVPAIPKLSQEVIADLLMPIKSWNTLSRTHRRALLRATCPLFTVRVSGNGKRGAGAKTVALPVGCYINLGGEPIPVRVPPQAAFSRQWQTPENTQPWISSADKPQFPLTTNPLVFLPLSV